MSGGGGAGRATRFWKKNHKHDYFGQKVTIIQIIIFEFENMMHLFSISKKNNTHFVTKNVPLKIMHKITRK